MKYHTNIRNIELHNFIRNHFRVVIQYQSYLSILLHGYQLLWMFETSFKKIFKTPAKYLKNILISTILMRIYQLFHSESI